MSGLDETEYRKLSEIVEHTEKAINEGKIPASDMMANFLLNARQRMGVLETETDALHDHSKKDKSAQMDALIVAMVERETRLSATEKQAYAEFLEKEYFTRDDLSRLERFYADDGAWDRLSEKGKEQMGIRLEESIRRGEIDVNEMSPSMQKKHSDWIYSQLSQGKDAGGKLASLSAEGRATFMREHEAGNYGAAREIFSGKGSFDYQLVDNQAASKRRLEAGSEREEQTEDSKLVKKDVDKDKITKTDDELLTSYPQNPTELKPTQSGNALGA